MKAAVTKLAMMMVVMSIQTMAVLFTMLTLTSSILLLPYLSLTSSSPHFPCPYQHQVEAEKAMTGGVDWNDLSKPLEESTAD